MEREQAQKQAQKMAEIEEIEEGTIMNTISHSGVPYGVAHNP